MVSICAEHQVKSIVGAHTTVATVRSGEEENELPIMLDPLETLYPGVGVADRDLVGDLHPRPAQHFPKPMACLPLAF